MNREIIIRNERPEDYRAVVICTRFSGHWLKNE